MASQITSFTIVYSTVYSGRSKKTKLRVTGLCTVNSPVTGEFPPKWSVKRKMFPFDDVIMSRFEFADILFRIPVHQAQSYSRDKTVH